MKRLISCAVVALAVVLVGAARADEPNKPDPFNLPAGYSNARTATDPNKPQPAATPGELQSYSTLHSLGFEWDLGASDTNHDATCKVAYRREDESTWHDALPLFRVDYYGWYQTSVSADRPYNMLAGSVMFLRPGAAYVAKLTLTDPDGGSTEREVKIATRPVPDYGTPVRTLHVAAPKAGDETAGDGSEARPFRGIEAAEKAAQPGDLFWLHAGDYGNVTFKKSGTPAADQTGAQCRYIVWKGAGDGPATFPRAYVEGSNVWLEGLTFQHVDEKMGLRAADNTSDNVVRANTFRGFSYSVVLSNTARRWYVADNDIVGDGNGGIAGEGVEMHKSSDHTVCYNRMTKTADGTSYPKRNCDVFANDVFEVTDDGVEPDYGYANNRIWGNRLDAPAGITFQPMLCGPWYIVRNQVISSTNLFKLRVQDRYLVANNTFLGYNPEAGAKVPHAHGLLTATMRNNLWIHGGGSPYLWSVQAPPKDPQREYLRKHVLFEIMKADWRTDIDYDGFDWSSASKGKTGKPMPFAWNGARLEDLSALAANLGIEKHGILVDKEKIFASYTPPPYDPKSRPTFLLNPSGNAVDAGVPLPNISEEFSGKSPDLGAFEAGVPVTRVGPRGDNWRAVHNEWVLKHQR